MKKRMEVALMELVIAGLIERLKGTDQKFGDALYFQWSRACGQEGEPDADIEAAILQTATEGLRAGGVVTSEDVKAILHQQGRTVKTAAARPDLESTIAALGDEGAGLRERIAERDADMKKTLADLDRSRKDLAGARGRIEGLEAMLGGDGAGDEPTQGHLGTLGDETQVRAEIERLLGE